MYRKERNKERKNKIKIREIGLSFNQANIFTDKEMKPQFMPTQST